MSATALAERQVDLKKRSTFLGCSDAAAVLGLSPYKTRADVWLEKTERVVPPPLESGPATWGTILEEPVAKYWAKQTGLKVRKTSKHYQHKGHPFLVGHLDRTVDGTDRFLEVKTASTWKADEWGETGTDNIPLGYRLQLASYFALTRFKFAELACLIGGQDFRMYTIERDDALVQKVVESLAGFWTEYVLGDTEPPPLSIDEAKSLWPVHEPDKFVSVQIDDELVGKWERWHAVGELLADLSKERDEIEAAFAERMGDSEALYCVGMEQDLASFKNESRALLDQKRLRSDKPHLFREYQRLSSPRVFRMKKLAKRKKKR